MMWGLILPLIWAASFCYAELVYDEATCRNVSLSGSSWPSDHGDSSRSKFTINAGLPKDFNAGDIKFASSSDLHATQWLYTAGDNSEYVYTMSDIGALKVSKSNATTLEVIQSVMLDPGIYVGGLIMHKNGHVYAVHANTITAFWNGDLYNSTKKVLPTTLNGKLTQTNGVIVTSDGLLAIKQWSFIPDDVFLHIYAMFRVPVWLLFAAIIFSGVYVVGRIARAAKFPYPMFLGLTFGLLLGWFFLMCFFMIMYTALGFYPFDPIRFLTTNTFSNDKGGGGELKLIDPITLEARAEIFLKERCSFARMALTTLPTGEDGLVLLGDEFVHQYRWNAKDNALYEVEEWAARYRTRWGTFPGTGPAIYNNKAYFTDNTFPINLFANTYSLFSIEMLTPRDYKKMGIGQCTSGDKCTMPELQRVSLTNGTAGFMYWSVVISPVEGDLIVWDSAGGSVQSRRLSDLSLHWSINAWQADCISVAADKGHVYFSDYNYAPSKWYYWMNSAGPLAPVYDNLKKYFIVADAKDGSIIANVSVCDDCDTKMSVIAPGGNNDVFLPTRTELLRIYV